MKNPEVSMLPIRSMSALFLALSILIFVSCKKDKSSRSSSSNDTIVITDNLKEPAKMVDLAVASMSSTANTNMASDMVSSLALPALAGDGFTLDDCDEHAEPKARSGDSASDKDDSGRLRISNPRMPLQDFYCKISKDTNAPDSFVGALSSNASIFCVMGKGLTFDGKEQDVNITGDELKACFGDDKEMEDVTEVKGTLTASTPPAFGDKDAWDASIELVVDVGEMKEHLKMLLKDSDDIIAFATTDNGGRDKMVDAYTVAIDKKNGSIRYEAKFQRIRSPDGTSSNGWNRHAIAYVTGKFDEDYKFTSVTDAQGIYSDISINYGNKNPTNSDASLQYGTFWTLDGSTDGGFKTYAYELSCSQESGENTCPEGNKASDWKATSGSGACDGALSGTTCSTKGLAFTKDAQASFAMGLTHDKFQTTEDWFEALPVPAYTTLTIDINQ